MKKCTARCHVDFIDPLKPSKVPRLEHDPKDLFDTHTAPSDLEAAPECQSLIEGYQGVAKTIEAGVPYLALLALCPWQSLSRGFQAQGWDLCTEDFSGMTH